MEIAIGNNINCNTNWKCSLRKKNARNTERKTQNEHQLSKSYFLCIVKKKKKQKRRNENKDRLKRFVAILTRSQAALLLLLSHFFISRVFSRLNFVVFPIVVLMWNRFSSSSRLDSCARSAKFYNFQHHCAFHFRTRTYKNNWEQEKKNYNNNFWRFAFFMILFRLLFFLRITE